MFKLDSFHRVKEKGLSRDVSVLRSQCGAGRTGRGSTGLRLQMQKLTPAKLRGKVMHWKDVWWLTECPGRLENEAQKLTWTCGKLGGWNRSQGGDATGLASLLLADPNATTPSRMSSELPLLFCATHSRGKAKAEHLVGQLRSHVHILAVGGLVE